MEDPNEGARVWWQIVVGVITLVMVTVVSVSFVTNKRNVSRRLPPGPRGIPLFGSLLSIGTLPHHTFSKWSKQYGPLMFIHMASIPTLVVSSPDMAREIFKVNDHIMCSRPSHMIPAYLTYNKKDILFSPYGQDWRRARKISTLELFTTARISRFEFVLHGEQLLVLQSILESSQTGKVLNMKEVFTNLASNTITQTMWNKRHFFSEGESKNTEAIGSNFEELVTEYSKLLGVFNIGDYIPFLTPLSMKFLGLEKRMKVSFQRMDEFLETVIDEHRKTESLAEERNDYVDVLLKVSKQAESDEIPMDIVKALLMDGLVGATDTSATVLEWALTEVMRHPSIMKRIQDELDLVVGSDRLVAVVDIPNLKYFQAVIKENFRLHPPAPLCAPHKSIEDCEIGGYHIPAGTEIFVNTWSIHRDPTNYERPLEFDPDRFLNSTLDVRGQHYQLLPFGSGRRMCPAHNLGIASVHFTLIRLLHAFTWTLPGDIKPEDLDTLEAFGLTCPKALPLTLLAKPRLATHIILPTSA